MNTQLKQYYNKIYQHKNHIPHAQQTEHVIKKEIINTQQKYIKIKNGILYINTLPLIKIKHGTCPECNCKTYSYDMWRGEKVCPQCGLILEEGLPQQAYTHNNTPTKNTNQPTQYTYEEKKFLKKYGHHKPYTPLHEWITRNDTKTINILTQQAQLNKTQKLHTQHIINTIGFKKLHSRATKTEIILAVIRYVLKQSKTLPAQLRYNQGIFKNQLNKETYHTIEQNINLYFNNQITQNTYTTITHTNSSP